MFINFRTTIVTYHIIVYFEFLAYSTKQNITIVMLITVSVLLIKPKSNIKDTIFIQ